MGAAIGSLAEIRARLAPAPAASRALPPATVAAIRAADGWRVWLSLRGSGDVQLSADEARRLIGELQNYTDVVEGRWL